MDLVRFLDDLLRFFAGKALLSLELELFELAVLFLWVHNLTLNNGSGGCWADRLVSPHRCDVTAHTSGVRSAHLALHVLLLVKRFLTQCGLTGSQETRDGYRRELRHFTCWRDRNHPHMHLRELDPALVDGWLGATA